MGNFFHLDRGKHKTTLRNQRGFVFSGALGEVADSENIISTHSNWLFRGKSKESFKKAPVHRGFLLCLLVKVTNTHEMKEHESH